ncbi:DMT family transporter [Microbaculum sp. FT89]|uniref:DMT family transporter n=1 Tax=Microbaculum sp. FT89 TaxID=3447298 RepID=UPI003F52D2C6
MRRSFANLTLLFAAFIWGTAFVAQSTAMDNVGPFLFTGLRFLLAAVAILPLALRERKRGAAMDRTGWMLAIATAITFFAGSILQQIGLQYTSVTNAGFLTGLYVVLVPFVAWVVFRSMPHAVAWPAAAMSFAGTILLSGGGIAPLGLGDGLMVIAAVFWALQVALLGYTAARTGRPVTIAFVQFVIGGLLGTAIAPFAEPVEMDRIAAAGVEILYAGLLSGGVGYTLQAIGQRWTPPADAAVILSSEALFAAAAGALLLGERLTVIGLGGATLIMVAILIVQLAPLAFRTARN